MYVGAPWCEPCQVFHQALVAGELDRELSGVRFVEFDLDRDAEPLRAAGYAAPMIPLFALPEASGRASSFVTHIEMGVPRVFPSKVPERI